MLNKQFVERKIKLMGEDLSRLEELGDYTLDELAKDFYKFSTAERLLEKIITRAIDVNSHFIAELGKGTEKVRGYYDTFLRLYDLGVYSEKFAKKIAQSARFRNVLVHEYNEVDEEIVHHSIREALGDFTKYCQYIIKFVEKKKGEKQK